jgi:phosphoribosyl-AMP cyclohydrolase
MRTKLGTFRYPVEVGDLSRQSFEEFRPWVDTGALYSQFPSSILLSLGHQPDATRAFRLADGTVIERPVGQIPIRIGQETWPVICVYGPEGSEMLLGATTLNTFCLAPDPVNETLKPTIAVLLQMTEVNELEESSDLRLDYGKLAGLSGVIPCAVQNADTREVILVAYVNEEALDAAVKTRSAVFWSTSRNELWEKGKTSGETFELVEVRVNCEQNSLVYVVRPRRGGICHTRNRRGEPRNCFYRRLDFETSRLHNLDP